MVKVRQLLAWLKVRPVLVGGAVCLLALLERYREAGRIWQVRVDLFGGADAVEGFVWAPVILLGVGSGLMTVALSVEQLRALRSSGRLRPGTALMLAAGVALGAASSLGWWLSPSRATTAEAVRRGGDVVRAVEAFRVAHGQAPRTLDDLVPQYLGSVPRTGLGHWRPFYLYVPGNQTAARASVRTGLVNALELYRARILAFGDPYALAVPCRGGGTLVYRPSGSYVDLPPGKAVGSWFHSSMD